jgi:predicted alpha/beta hydrolase
MALAATRRAIKTQPVKLIAADGYELSGLLVEAALPRGALVINSGAGFPREFYLKFASYAAQRGYHALVYDYRGIGASCNGPLKDSRARMIDWGRLDIPAAFQWLAERFPELPLFTVGHSIGAQFVGLIPNAALARGHVMITVSFAYWRWEPFPFRYVAWFFWKVFGPLMLRLYGYVPQGRVWSGLSLPRGVYLQWREWGLRKTHFVPDLTGDERERKLGGLRGPLLAYQFEDDPIATRKTAPPLFALYASAQIDQRWIHPKDVGVRRIGHQGFFSERLRDSLWTAIFDWLDARASTIAQMTTAPPIT